MIIMIMIIVIIIMIIILTITLLLGNGPLGWPCHFVWRRPRKIAWLGRIVCPRFRNRCYLQFWTNGTTNLHNPHCYDVICAQVKLQNKLKPSKARTSEAPGVPRILACSAALGTRGLAAQGHCARARQFLNPAAARHVPEHPARVGVGRLGIGYLTRPVISWIAVGDCGA